MLVFDALSRPGVEENLALLKARHPRQISSRVADVRNPDAVAEAVADAEAVFHLAAQVAVTTSLEDLSSDLCRSRITVPMSRQRICSAPAVRQNCL